MTLDKVAPGQGGVITQVGGEGVLRRRLLDMGLTPGTRVSVRKIAPMGDPIELFLRSYVLTIRKEEAANIAVEGVEETALPRAAEHRPESAEGHPRRRGAEHRPESEGGHPHHCGAAHCPESEGDHPHHRGGRQAEHHKWRWGR